MLEALAIGAVFVIGWVGRRRDPDGEGARYVVGLAVPLMIAALAVPHAMLAWHGDALEVGRHGVVAAVQLRIGLGIIAVMVVDRMLPKRDIA